MTIDVETVIMKCPNISENIVAIMGVKHLIELLQDQLPKDVSHQITSGYYIDLLFKEQNERINTVLDLGCGEGNSQNIFQCKKKDIKWIGLDIESSPEISNRTRHSEKFCAYDGINIPFENNYFDLIYSNQVLEHARHPIELLADVYRVLKPGGYFIGSTSQFEPYHSYSYWNYTPYGLTALLEEVEFEVQEIRPSIDGLTLIIRCGLGSPKFFSRWWAKESPLNSMISLAGKLKKLDTKTINAIKLLFCGQFCFIARK